MNNNNLFTAAGVLIPEEKFLERWSVIACDQFSSQPEYWQRVSKFAGDAPSALNLIIPEAFLGETDENTQIRNIGAKMDEYLKSNVFREVRNAFIYVGRTLPDGRVRKGIVGAIDLEEYDFTGKQSAIRASEGTVLERLPARINIRRAASIEIPHIIAFIDDAGGTVFGLMEDKAFKPEPVYSFSLMEGGGFIKGSAVTGEEAGSITAAINAICNKNNASGKDKPPVLVIGDGNHSLAGAKVYWDEIKQNLSGPEREVHPARRALVEICNVYDPAISFEAIHRLLINTDVPGFIKAFEKAMPRGSDYTVQWVTGDDKGEIGIKASCIGDMLVAVQDFIDEYMKQHPGSGTDYVHGSDALTELAQKKNNLGLILPAMDKSELFKTVAARGVFPRKSFSVGHARDKRYYLECRRIK